jgi:hypothetical protein
MAGERLSMRKIKEVLRLKFENHLSVRQIAESCGIGKSTVQEYFDRAQKADLTWPLAPEMDDAALENLLFPPHSLRLPQPLYSPIRGQQFIYFGEYSLHPLRDKMSSEKFCQGSR